MVAERKTFGRSWLAGGLLATALAAYLTTALGEAHDPVPKATWTRDVEPIMSVHCMSCHSPEGAALPSLTSLEEVKIHSDAVKSAVIERRMPIWGALRGFGAFEHDPSLSPQQIATVAAWIEAGAPPGSPAAHRSADPRGAPARAPVGEPVRMRLPPFAGTDAVREDVVHLGAGTPGLVGAWQFIPGDTTVQQVDFTDAAGRPLWTWWPGLKGAVVFPPGTAMRLSDRVLRVRTTRRIQDGRGSYRPPKRVESVLQFWRATDSVPLRWQEVTCGGTTPLDGPVYAIRPDRINSGAIEVAATDPPRILGRFIHADAPLIYWLRQPVAKSSRGVISVRGTGCTAALLTTGRARPRPNR